MVWVNLTREQIDVLTSTLGAVEEEMTGINAGGGLIAQVLREAVTPDPLAEKYAAKAEDMSGDARVDASSRVQHDLGGAWVMAWVWVGEDDLEADEPVTCPGCGAVEGTPEWGAVGDGYDGYCPSCADKRES